MDMISDFLQTGANLDWALAQRPKPLAQSTPIRRYLFSPSGDISLLIEEVKYLGRSRKRTPFHGDEGVRKKLHF